MKREHFVVDVKINFSNIQKHPVVKKGGGRLVQVGSQIFIIKDTA